MPSLQIRKLPEKLYNALKRAAKEQRRSLSQQAIIALSRGLDEKINLKDRRQSILNKLKLENQTRQRWKDVDITSWIRADRDNR